jgi:hypothetical protein
LFSPELELSVAARWQPLFTPTNGYIFDSGNRKLPLVGRRKSSSNGHHPDAELADVKGAASISPTDRDAVGADCDKQSTDDQPNAGESPT